MELERVEPPSRDRRRSREPWHAVAIVAPANGCAAACALKGRRFISSEAPRLPLSDCTEAAECRCVYRHHADRRAGSRRAADRAGMPSPPRAQAERRASRGRRATDA